MNYLLDDNALVDVVQTLRKGRNSSSSSMVTTSSAAVAEAEIFGHLQSLAMSSSSASASTGGRHSKRGGPSLSAPSAAARVARTNLTRALQEQHATYLAHLEDAIISLPSARAKGDEQQGLGSTSKKQQLGTAPPSRKRPRKDAVQLPVGPSVAAAAASSKNSSSSFAGRPEEEGSLASGVQEDAAAWHLFTHWLATEDALSLERAQAEEVHRVPSFTAMSAATADGYSKKWRSGGGGNHLCSVCLLPAPYRCDRCKVALFCSVRCSDIHDATRCQKFLA